ncbi:NAD(P)-dependent oxidoreductase [Nocardioides terrisoli]|uniref:NAD(P)-dependent oxidoreductase n=1 Tax=Nocardioides terrisoli TaxID=3388267 RepID=UPI00287B80C8|nr:NAD(P)H-binding protein [Nocardioides marmorisolisilvae]
MSQLVIFGGTGYAGSHIAREAVGRGHAVTSYSRNEPTERYDGIDYRTGSVADPEVVAAAAQDADELVVAVHGADVGGQPLLDVLPALVGAAQTGRARLSFVGGAGSSYVAEGGPLLLDTPEFNEEWKPEARAHAAVLEALRAAPEGLDWFYVSPAGLFGVWAPGEDTGSYRTGGDILVTKDDGSSEISGTDFARAYVDEIEQRNHVRRRFTVGH